MNKVGRIWASVKFAFRALAYEWRNGPGSKFVGPGAKPAPTIVEYMSEVRALLEEREAIPAQSVLAPPRPPGPSLPAPRPPAPSRSHPPLELDQVPPYYVQTYEGESVVSTYAGTMGRDYRKCIESLRAEGVTFHAWMNGEPHDWGPRQGVVAGALSSRQLTVT